jgi:hypothetical protein
MVAVDGQYFHAMSEGSVHKVDPSVMVPFASVTFFDNDSAIIVSGSRNLSTFTNGIDKGLPSKNLIYAIRADTIFPEMVVRAIQRQANAVSSAYRGSHPPGCYQVGKYLRNHCGVLPSRIYERGQYARVPPPLYFIRPEERRTYP